MKPTSLSDFIKNKRKELGMSQRDLAKASGISKAYVCVLEQGGNPSWNTIVKVLQALGFEVLIKKL